VLLERFHQTLVCILFLDRDMLGISGSISFANYRKSDMPFITE